MARWTLHTAGAALTILVAGCGSGNDAAKGGVTPHEAQALNEAAAMLDDNGQDAAQDVGVTTNAADNDAAPDSAQ